MTVQELIKLGAQKVRRDSNLMQTYIKLFKDTFGHEPNCAGCTFNNDWNRLTSLNQPQTIQIMADVNFKLKDNTSIYTYKNKEGRNVRTYGNSMSQEFAEAYLTHGTKEEIERRKNEFKTLPTTAEPKAAAPEADAEDLSKLTYKELQKLAEKKGYKGKSHKKEDLLIFLESQV